MGFFSNPLSYAGYPPAENIPGKPGQAEVQNSTVRAATSAEVIAGLIDWAYVSPLTLTGSGSELGPRTPHTVILGEGLTNPLGNSNVGTDGQVLTANMGADPSFDNIGTKSGLTAHGVVIAEGTAAFHATAVGVAGQILTSNGPGIDPTFQSAGGAGGTVDYADFYALMPGDNAATVAPGTPILLPNDGPSSGTSITRLTSSTFQLADIATYEISFQCSFDEAGQMQLAIGGAGLAYTVSGRATGTNQVYINALVTTSGLNEVLSVINPAGNATALTITPIAGGTHAVSAHLVIVKVAGGPGGGMLNTINSVVPSAGNIDITSTSLTVTTGVNTVNIEEKASAAYVPAFSLSSPGTSLWTYSSQFGRYARVGGIVYFTAQLVTSAFAVGTGSGTWLINLPVAAGAYASPGIIQVTGVGLDITGETANLPLNFIATIGSGASVATLSAEEGGAANASSDIYNMVAADATASAVATINVSGFYFAA